MKPEATAELRMDLTNSPMQPEGEDTAKYISMLARELRIMAAKADLGFLAYLLPMVEDEATATVRKQTERREGT